MFYKNWISSFSFLIMGVALAISIYDKRKRMEVIVLISVVIGMLLFFSSSYVAGSTSPDIKAVKALLSEATLVPPNCSL